MDGRSDRNESDLTFMTESKKLGNPAVVGLGGFGLTTLLLQIHNLGLCSTGPVLAMGLIFGGLCQMIAGFQEQKMGNNFGYCAFVAYGAFWIGLGIIWICNLMGVFVSTGTDVGWYLVAWTGFSAILWVGSFMVHKAMAFTFSVLMVGFVLLDIGHFGYPVCNTIAAYVLIICALGAWYMMAAIVLNDLAGRVILPVGKPLQIGAK
jgi:succinate-acetate transporter protein